MPENSDAIVERLDRLIAVLTVIHEERLSDIREEIATDKVTAAILRMTTGTWVNSGELQRAVAKRTGVATKTVQRAVNQLCERQILRSSGSGKSTRFKATGAI